MDLTNTTRSATHLGSHVPAMASAIMDTSTTVTAINGDLVIKNDFLYEVQDTEHIDYQEVIIDDIEKIVGDLNRDHDEHAAKTVRRAIRNGGHELINYNDDQHSRTPIKAALVAGAETAYPDESVYPHFAPTLGDVAGFTVVDDVKGDIPHMAVGSKDAPTLNIARLELAGARIDPADDGFLVYLPYGIDASQVAFQMRDTKIVLDPIGDKIMMAFRGVRTNKNGNNTVTILVDRTPEVNEIDQDQLVIERNDARTFEEETKIPIVKRWAASLAARGHSPKPPTTYWFNFKKTDSLSWKYGDWAITASCATCSLSGGIIIKHTTHNKHTIVSAYTTGVTATMLLELAGSFARTSSDPTLVPIYRFGPNPTTIGGTTIDIGFTDSIGFGLTSLSANVKVTGGGKLTFPDGELVSFKKGWKPKLMRPKDWRSRLPTLTIYKPVLYAEVDSEFTFLNVLEANIDLSIAGLSAGGSLKLEIPRITLENTVAFDKSCGLCGGASRAITSKLQVGITATGSVHAGPYTVDVGNWAFKGDIWNFCLGVSKICKSNKIDFAKIELDKLLANTAYMQPLVALPGLEDYDGYGITELTEDEMNQIDEVTAKVQSKNMEFVETKHDAIIGHYTGDDNIAKVSSNGMVYSGHYADLKGATPMGKWDVDEDSVERGRFDEFEGDDDYDDDDDDDDYDDDDDDEDYE